MSVTRASDLAKRRFKGMKLSKPFSELLGDIEPRAYLLIWGPAGSGKSTFALALADELARNGPVLYVSAEEGVSKTVRDRINRLGATHADLYVAEYLGLEQIKLQVRKTGATAVLLDSISQIDPSSERFAVLAREFHKAGIGLGVIAHATKDGKTYKGPSSVGHNPDIIIRVRGGEATTEKNRYAPAHVTIDVPFTAAALPRNGSRRNPVRVPFTTTLRDVVAVVKPRGVAALNSAVGFEYPAFLDWMDLHEDVRDDLAERLRANNTSFRWRTKSRIERVAHDDGPGAREKIGVLEMIRYKRQLDLLPDEDTDADADLDRYAEGETYIEQFEGRDFADALRKLIAAYGSMRVVVTDQAHAKKVLGAKEYGRQSRAAEASNGKAAPKKASKPKASTPTPPNDPPRRKPAKAAPKPRSVKPKAETKPTAPKRTTTGGGASSGRKPRSKSSSQDTAAQRFDDGIASLTAALSKLDGA